MINVGRKSTKNNKPNEEKVERGKKRPLAMHLMRFINIESHRNDTHMLNQPGHEPKSIMNTSCNAPQITLQSCSSNSPKSNKSQVLENPNTQSRNPSLSRNSVVDLANEHVNKMPPNMRGQVQSK